ncbi:hypothetical protein ABPG77_000902 [Micractinium sp. CCAP 211/92]
MKVSEVLQRLSEDGWSLDEQATTAYLEAECGSAVALPQALHALLNADLAQVGAAALPGDVNRAHSKTLTGPLVLQVSSVADISQPSRASGDSERKGRILRLKLTDGRGSCVGVELQPLPLSMEQLCPGTKVRLRGATVRCGVLLLGPRCLELLGGRVEPLAESWETQQKYGGTTVERADSDADKPPAFRHFDPKLAKYGSRRGQAAVRAAAAAGSAAADKGNGTSAGPPTTAAGALAGLSQQQQQQQQRRVARAGFQPYQPPVARHEQQAAPEALGQQAVLPGRQQQRPQQQKHDRGRGRQQGQRTGDAAGLAAAPAAAPPPPAPAAGVAAQQPGQQQQQQQQQQPGQQHQSAAAQKLLGRLQVEEGRFGRGPRRGRRSRFDDDADDGSMTLEEWEARQAAARAAPAPPSQQQVSDEELARQLQRQLDLEAAQERAALAQVPSDLAASVQSMFTYSTDEAGKGNDGRGGRGRGRGRHGSSGSGRGRGRR